MPDIFKDNLKYFWRILRINKSLNMSREDTTDVWYLPHHVQPCYICDISHNEHVINASNAVLQIHDNSKVVRVKEYANSKPLKSMPMLHWHAFQLFGCTLKYKSCSSCSALISCYPSALYNPLLNHQHIPFTAKHLHKSEKKIFVFLLQTLELLKVIIVQLLSSELVNPSNFAASTSCYVDRLTLPVGNMAFSCVMYQNTKILAVHTFSTTATIWWIWVLSLAYWFWWQKFRLRKAVFRFENDA